MNKMDEYMNTKEALDAVLDLARENIAATNWSPSDIDIEIENNIACDIVEEYINSLSKDSV